VAYLVNAADLHPKDVGKDITKFTDDAYLFASTENVDIRQQEMTSVEAGTTTNNLRLNQGKSGNIVFQKMGRKIDPAVRLTLLGTT